MMLLYVKEKGYKAKLGDFLHPQNVPKPFAEGDTIQ